MKNKILIFVFSCFTLPISILSHAANDTFEELFNIKHYKNSIFLNNKHDIVLPTSGVTPVQRLYKHMQTAGDLEFYLTPNNKRLVIVPMNRKYLYYYSPVVVQLLHEADKVDTTFEFKAKQKDANATKANNTEGKQTICALESLDKNPKVLEIIVQYLEGHARQQKTESSITVKNQSIRETLVSFLYNNSLTVNCLIYNIKSVFNRGYLYASLSCSDSYNYTIDKLTGALSVLKLSKKCEVCDDCKQDCYQGCTKDCHKSCSKDPGKK